MMKDWDPMAKDYFSNRNAYDLDTDDAEVAGNSLNIRDLKQRGRKRERRRLQKITFLVSSLLLCANHFQNQFRGLHQALGFQLLLITVYGFSAQKSVKPICNYFWFHKDLILNQ